MNNVSTTGLDNIPAELRGIPRWVCWRSEGERPIDCHTGQTADITDPACWSTFDEAITFHRAHSQSGVGLVLFNDGYAAVTIDDGYDEQTKTFRGSAKDLVRMFDSYCELGPDGTSVTVFVRGRLPEQQRVKDGVALYSDAHYVPVTGRRLMCWRSDNETVPVEARQPALLKLFHALGDGKPVLSDDDLLSMAKKAKNGEKFKRLWGGDTTGYPSRSEADLALCGMLAFWTQGEADRVCALFKRSGLSRKKWCNQDYRERTIHQALAGLTEFFQPTMLTSVTRLNQEYPVYTGVINKHGGAVELEQGMQMAVELAETVRDARDWEASFKLARRLRKLTDIKPEQFEEAVKAFCEKTGRPFEPFWYDFLVVWDKVNSAEGDDALVWAAAQAEKEPYTHTSCSLGGVYHAIAGLSWHLSRLTPGKPFWLPRKRLGELYDVTAMTITRVVTLLERNGIIKCVNDNYRYSKGEAKAKEYLFVGPTPTEFFADDNAA